MKIYIIIDFPIIIFPFIIDISSRAKLKAVH